MSGFWRSNRLSLSNQNTSNPSNNHRRGVSYGDTLTASAQATQAEAAANELHRSRSSSRTPSGGMSLRGMERLEKRRTMEERNFLQAKARSQNLNPPVDLRLLDYVSPYDDNLVCPICRCPFVDPVVLTECDHCFCRDCIRQTWTTSTAYNPLGPRGDCPTCRTPAKLGPRSATSKILVNILDDLVVQCPKTSDGCKAKVKRGEVQDHMSIYCGYAMVECPADGCELALRRKDSTQGCLHYGVSCLACRGEMQRCELETHWRNKCPDREITCELCKSEVYYRDLPDHNSRKCPATSVKCPGEALGCNIRSRRGQAEVHAKTCTFAKLAPVLAAQTQRMDEQEAAQKQMSRKLEVLENGFASMHSILYPRAIEDPDQTSADPSSIPLLQGHGSEDEDIEEESATPMTGNIEVGFAPTEAVRPVNRATRAGSSDRPNRVAPGAPGPRPTDLPEPFSPDFDLASPFPPPAANGPYVSPLHHMLSMHESLRDEMSRINSALQELDGRHSMQILNENMRTREEITYMGAQVAGLSRQVHWLTSAQLQRQSRTPTPGTTGASDMAAAGPSVEAAINSAVRGAARMVGAGGQNVPAMRRGPSEEGRTKL